MEGKLHYVPIKEVLQQSKPLENSTEESLTYESHILSFQDNLSHNPNLITTSCEVNSATNESHSAKTSGVVAHSVTSTFSMKENPLYESHNVARPIHRGIDQNTF